MELNITFDLEEPAENYIRAIRPFFYKCRYMKKTEPKNSRIDPDGMRGLSGLTRENDSIAVKAYDKSTSEKAKKRGTPENFLDQNLIRFEFVIKDAKKIRDVFGTASIHKIDDSMLLSTFDSLCDYYLFYSYDEWENFSRRKVKSLIRKYRNPGSHKPWVRSLLEECSDIELKREIPVIFDVDDLGNVIKSIKKRDPNHNKSRILRELKKRNWTITTMTYKPGEHDRAKEIAEKIRGMCIDPEKNDK